MAERSLKPGVKYPSNKWGAFSDELPEFERKVLDALRQPGKSGEIIISRANAKIQFPARFQLVAAMNPSPTGHYIRHITALHRNKLCVI